MLKVILNDDQTGTIARLEIPGNKITQVKVAEELSRVGEYSYYKIHSHPDSWIEVFFKSTEDFYKLASWIFTEIQKLSAT